MKSLSFPLPDYAVAGRGWLLRHWRTPVSLSPELLVLLVSVMFTLFYNGAFWHGVLAAEDLGWLQMGSYGLLLTSLQFLLMAAFVYCMSARVLLPLLIVIAAAVSYFTSHYGTYFDVGMIDNILQTDSHEARELLTPGFARHLLLFAVLPCLLVRRTGILRIPGKAALRRRLAWVAGAVAVFMVALLISYQSLASVMRNDKALRYLATPANYLVSMGRVLAAADPLPAMRIPIGEDAVLLPHKGNKPLLMVIVVGETVRAANWGLNGYARQTTPQLARRQGIVNFTDVSSCGTSTAVSLPCMFSSLGKQHYDKRSIESHESLLDVLQHAGFDVLWLDNQSGCKGVCDGVTSRRIAASDYPSRCGDGRCQDQVLVEEMRKQLDAVKAGVKKNTVVVLHQMGNHGPAYFQRYPEALRTFTPTCDSADLNRCTRQQIVNSYDNAILNTDAVLGGVIDYLGQQSGYAASMLYVSDHGESLGENGIYLHGLPYAIAPQQQTRVPMLWWSSADFDEAVDLDKACLEKTAHRALSHDNLFSTVLGVLGVTTGIARPELDITADASHRGVGQC